MELRYFIDWCPVSTLPVYNGLWKCDGLTRRSARDIGRTELSRLFERHHELMMFEYAMRLDGLFVFRIGLRPGTPSMAYTELPNELSEIIKGIAGHRHDFHAYPYPVAVPADAGWWKACAWCLRGCRFVLRKLRLTATQMRDQLDIDLHIRPVEIEDPFTDEFKQHTRKNFVALSQIIDPDDGDTALAQLRVRHAGGEGSTQRACLRLRALFAGKKERCLVAYRRRQRWLSSLAPALIYGVLCAAGMFAALHGYFTVGQKTSLAVAFVTGLGVVIFLDDRLQAPKLEVIQRTLGFYAYANIYSTLTEAMYRNTAGGPNFNADTGNFGDLMDTLKARLDLERQAITNRKYLWTIGFALIAVIVALTKLSIELERITSGVQVISAPMGAEVKATYQVGNAGMAEPDSAGQGEHGGRE